MLSQSRVLKPFSLHRAMELHSIREPALFLPELPAHRTHCSAAQMRATQERYKLQKHEKWHVPNYRRRVVLHRPPILQCQMEGSHPIPFSIISRLPHIFRTRILPWNNFFKCQPHSWNGSSLCGKRLAPILAGASRHTDDSIGTVVRFVPRKLTSNRANNESNLRTDFGRKKKLIDFFFACLEHHHLIYILQQPLIIT